MAGYIAEVAGRLSCPDVQIVNLGLVDNHTDPAVREQAIAHNIRCIRFGEELGSKALTLWIADGANFPGQQHLAQAFERYLESAARSYAAVPADWRLLIEHKMYESAFYATVVQDCDSSPMAAQSLSPGHAGRPWS